MRPLIIPTLFLFTVSTLAFDASARDIAAPLQFAARGASVPDENESRRPDPVVRRIQKQLAQIGLYQGPVDGIMGPRTAQAIRTFQKSRGFKVDGRATSTLATTLETDEKVDQLLQRLESVRNKKVDAARDALLADPRTRHLLDEKARDEVADPTRDAEPCFQAPTPKCLLTEAVDSAKAVFKEELRDWALGEILAAQGRAGLSADAMATARRITDPRLIMVALRKIAEALAHAGESAAAMGAADTIPDKEKRLAAYATIAEIQAGLSDSESIDITVDRTIALLGNASKIDQVSYLTRFAILYNSLGNDLASKRYMAKAASLASQQHSPTARSAALRHVAIAHADLAHPDEAQALLVSLTTASDRTPVLSSVAKAYARNGAADKALAAAGEIEAGRYRAVTLSRIAAVLAHAGDVNKATMAIQQAQFVADQIKLPYARSFAASRVAMALLDMATASGDPFSKVIEAAETIDDNTLRAYTFWAIATEQRRAGDHDAAAYTETLAREAVKTIKSQLSQVWLYGDLSGSFSEAQETDSAWKAFNTGLDIAKAITNSWGRARALAKLSNALSVLTEPDSGSAERKKKVRLPDVPLPNGDRPH